MKHLRNRCTGFFSLRFKNPRHQGLVKISSQDAAAAGEADDEEESGDEEESEDDTAARFSRGDATDEENDQFEGVVYINPTATTIDLTGPSTSSPGAPITNSSTNASTPFTDTTSSFPTDHFVTSSSPFTDATGLAISSYDSGYQTSTVTEKYNGEDANESDTPSPRSEEQDVGAHEHIIAKRKLSKDAEKICTALPPSKRYKINLIYNKPKPKIVLHYNPDNDNTSDEETENGDEKEKEEDIASAASVPDDVLNIPDDDSMVQGDKEPLEWDDEELFGGFEYSVGERVSITYGVPDITEAFPEYIEPDLTGYKPIPEFIPYYSYNCPSCVAEGRDSITDSVEDESGTCPEHTEPESYTCRSSPDTNSYSSEGVAGVYAAQHVDDSNISDNDEVSSSSEGVHDDDTAEQNGEDAGSGNGDSEDSSSTSSSDTSSDSSSEEEDSDADADVEDGEENAEEYIEMNLDLGILEEVSTTTDNLAIANATAPTSRSHHGTPGSSSKRKAADDDDAEEIINFQPLNKKPKFVVTTDPNSVASKLPGFLEKLKAANAELEGRDEAEYRLEITGSAKKDGDDEVEEEKPAGIEEL